MVQVSWGFATPALYQRGVDRALRYIVTTYARAVRFGWILLLAACGRLGFDARSDGVPVDGAPDGSVDQAVDECGVVEQDTIALYTFEDALAGDASGAHSGSVRGNVTAGDGRCGATAAVFDTGYLLIPDAPAFDLDTGSVEMFVRLSTTATADNQTLLARDAQGTLSDGHFLILVTPAGDLVTRLQAGGATHYRCAAGFPSAQWVHVGVSFGGGATEGLRMWLDGAAASAPTSMLEGGPIDCTTSSTLGIAGNDNALVIGASNARGTVDGSPDPTPSQHVLGGEIDQVHLRAVWRDFGG
jgi:hypothetical protein